MIQDRRYPPLSVAARRGGDSASSAGASDLQGIPDAIAKRAAQLRFGDLRYATRFGERRCLCRGVACRFGDPSGSPTPNKSQRHQEHRARAHRSSVRDCRHGPRTPLNLLHRVGADHRTSALRECFLSQIQNALPRSPPASKPVLDLNDLGGGEVVPTQDGQLRGNHARQLCRQSS
jgi:hypothetical protein